MPSTASHCWFDYAGYPEYPQLWGEFAHGFPILDLLFNCGRDAPRYMKYYAGEVAKRETVRRHLVRSGQLLLGEAGVASEQRRMAGDPTKINRTSGWEATTAIDESLAAMLHHWEEELTHG